MRFSFLSFMFRLMPKHRFSLLALSLALFAALTASQAAEETAFAWPLGPIGGKFRIWTGESFIRVSEVTAGAPGAAAGLQVGDFITGAFGRAFDPITASKLDGPVRQLGAAIDHAETNNTALPLSIIRPGAGSLTLTINLPASSGLGPAYTLTSSRYAAIYDAACAGLHTRIMATSDGDIGYPTGFAGLALLGHQNWNDSTGSKPYRLSVNKVRDWAIATINSAILTPVEHKFFDGSANPNYVDSGLENWGLGLAVMFFSEYVTKTGEQATYQATLQRGATLMANRIQNWAQPNNGGTADRTYETSRGATGHGGVVGDYTHQWYVGINITGLHLFNGLAMAKRAGADMTQRPKDGHYFGYTYNPGDTIPATISPALPATIILPRGAQDSRSLPHIDNVTNAPFTTIKTVNASNNPFFYDCSLDQKFWLQWDCLTRSTESAGNVGYAAVTGGAYDAGGRTPGTVLGYKIYQNGATPSALDQELTDRQMNYIVSAHDIHLNSHAYNMGGACFTAMLMPYMADRNQRFFLENWKCFNNLAAQPNGTIQYFGGRDFQDPYMDTTVSMQTDIALAGSVARGGLPHLPGFSTNRVFPRFRQPLLEWPTAGARRLRKAAATESFSVELLDATGAAIPASQITAQWSVVSGPVTSGLIASPTSLNTTVNFPAAGNYRLQLTATDTASGYSTTETVDVQRLPTLSSNYVAGEADYRVYTGIAGTAVSNLTSAAKYPNSPDQVSNLTKLEGTYSGDSYGATITAYIVAPETGNYRFYIASDDTSSLLFNANGTDPAGAVQIASVPDWTDPYEWTYYSSQRSALIPLIAGQVYYIKALHKEGSGGDHLAVGWTTPSNATITVVDQPFIARAVTAAESATPAILTQPQNLTINLGDTATFSFTATEGAGPAFYQWRLNGENVGSASDSPTLTLTNVGARLAGSWDCVMTSGSTVLTTNAATLTINGVGVLNTGGLWQEVFTNVSGGSVGDLLSSSSYPRLSSSSGVITEPHTASFGDTYGQRWSGWLIPSTSGRYRFYIAADDAVSLYLSPDQYESHKQLIHSSNSYTDEMAWSSRGASAWVQLTAGQRYFVEFFHKEDGGGDHAAFTWQKEGDAVPTNGTGLIPSGNMQYAFGGTFPDGATAPPYATADTMNVAQGSTATLDVTLNDIDANPASLLVQAFTQPTNGSVTQNGRYLTYTPVPGYSGSDSFTYTLRNALNLISMATVNVTVTSPWTNMTAWWKLDENSGTTAADATGNGHTATLSSGTTWTTGKLGSGIYVASNTQMATTATGKPVPGSFTISAWMNPTNTSGIDTLFSFGSVAALRVNGSALRFTTFGVKDHDTAGSMFSGGTWTHIALTFTPSTTGGAKFYVNGVLRQSIDSSSINTAATGVWRIGASHVSGEWFGGALDDVRLYSRVLSDQDIATIAATTTPFEQWRIANHNPTQLGNAQLSGPLADPDKDGIGHLMEYALGLNPGVADKLSSKVTHDLENLTGSQYLRLSVTKNASATDVSYLVEVSSDLVTWTSVNTVVETNTATSLIVRDTVPMTGNTRRFIRLRVTSL